MGSVGRVGDVRVTILHNLLALRDLGAVIRAMRFLRHSYQEQLAWKEDN